MPRRCRPLSVTGLAIFAPIAVLALSPLPSGAQTVVADSGADLLQPSLQGNPANPPTFTPGNATPANQAPPPGKFTAPSRIGVAPTYGSPTGFGAGDTGFDSQNRTKSQRTAQVPAQGSSIAPPEPTFDPVPPPPPQISSQPPVLPPPPAPEVYPAKAAARPGATLPLPPDQLPISKSAGRSPSGIGGEPARRGVADPGGDLFRRFGVDAAAGDATAKHAAARRGAAAHFADRRRRSL